MIIATTTLTGAAAAATTSNEARVIPDAILAGPSGLGALSFDSVGVSGGTIAAHSDSPSMSGSVFVFTEPVTGWASQGPSAELTASNGAQLGDVAVSGNYVFVGSPTALPGGGAIFVFAKPTSGWSGSLHQVAILGTVGTSPTDFGRTVAASGRTVVASSDLGDYVFTEPARGWAGFVSQAATLEVPGERLPVAAISGKTIAAGSTLATVGTHDHQGAVYVFREPVVGWAGAVSPSATLTASNGRADDQLGIDVAISRSTIVAGRYSQVSATAAYVMDVFSEPSHGWSGTIHQQAERTVPANDGDYGPYVATSGRNIAALLDQQGGGHECPCNGSVYAAGEPTGEWSGNSALSAFATVVNDSPGSSAIALDGNTLAVGEDKGIRVFSILEPPTLSQTAISGLATLHPRIVFRVIASRGAPPIKMLDVGLPSGLRFDTSQKSIGQGITINGSANAAASAVRRGKLVIALKKPAPSVLVEVSGKPLIESAAMRSRFVTIERYDRAHTRKRSLKLAVSLEATDSTRFASSLRAVIKVG